MFSPRLSNGDWSADTTVVFLPRWNAYKAEGFTEGSPYTYQFGALHDVPGMIEMMGGTEAFRRKLMQVFEENRYHHDNEPGHHYIYLFNYIGDYSVTQRLLKEYISLNYQNAPSGLSGNEDCGQMSAWFVMSSLGFYPMPPASGIYSLGVPGARRFRLKLRGGSILEIVRDTDKQVTRVLSDGRLLEKPFVSHTELIKTKRLVFTR
jgi:putative alpha-1,2-mannosidase